MGRGAARARRAARAHRVPSVLARSLDPCESFDCARRGSGTGRHLFGAAGPGGVAAECGEAGAGSHYAVGGERAACGASDRDPAARAADRIHVPGGNSFVRRCGWTGTLTRRCIRARGRKETSATARSHNARQRENARARHRICAAASCGCAAGAFARRAASASSRSSDADDNHHQPAAGRHCAADSVFARTRTGNLPGTNTGSRARTAASSFT